MAHMLRLGIGETGFPGAAPRSGLAMRRDAVVPLHHHPYPPLVLDRGDGAFSTSVSERSARSKCCQCSGMQMVGVGVESRHHPCWSALAAAWRVAKVESFRANCWYHHPRSIQRLNRLDKIWGGVQKCASYFIHLMLRAWTAWPRQASLTFGHSEQSTSRGK